MSIVYYPGYSQVTIVPNFQWMQISSITQAFQMVLTTTLDHIYPAGVNVAFRIPLAFGMQELNELNAEILAVTNNTMTINIDSRNFTPFAYPSPLPTSYSLPTVYANASSLPLPPQPLPFGNEDTFEGCVYNNGQPGSLINQR